MTTRTSLNLHRGFATRGNRSKSPLAWLLTFNAIWRERQALGKMDSHILSDIGVSRSEAISEAKRPTWDAPERWHR